MTVAITYPSSAVTNGASVIQSNSFVLVAADYEKVDREGALAFYHDTGRKLEFFPEKPTNGQRWNFYIRKDMTGQNAGLRNMLGFQTEQILPKSTAFSPTTQGPANLTLQKFRVSCFNWHPVVITMTDTTAFHYWDVDIVTMPMRRDPETQLWLYDTGEYECLYEAVAGLMKPVAAGAPSILPALNALSGLIPFV